MTQPTDHSFFAEWNGVRYEVQVDDITRREWRDLRAELGLNQQELLLGLVQVDLDVVAGLLWLVIRRDKPDITLDDIDITYRAIVEEGPATDPPD